MGFFSSFRDAMNDDEGSLYEVAGEKVSCHHCGGMTFDRAKGRLNAAGLTFQDSSLTSSPVNMLVCTNCGHIEWFLGEVEEI